MNKNPVFQQQRKEIRQQQTFCVCLKHEIKFPPTKPDLVVYGDES